MDAESFRLLIVLMVAGIVVGSLGTAFGIWLGLTLGAKSKKAHWELAADGE